MEIGYSNARILRRVLIFVAITAVLLFLVGVKKAVAATTVKMNLVVQTTSGEEIFREVVPLSYSEDTGKA
ncbi:MAG: hypothetical protein K6F37_03605, partial [Lachnospiraceae bacterium]|nr:hypothetical protein [Lachnospiraceae bacterium]